MILNGTDPILREHPMPEFEVGQKAYSVKKRQSKKQQLSPVEHELSPMLGAPNTFMA